MISCPNDDASATSWEVFEPVAPEELVRSQDPVGISGNPGWWIVHTLYFLIVRISHRSFVFLTPPIRRFGRWIFLLVCCDMSVEGSVDQCLSKVAIWYCHACFEHVFYLFTNCYYTYIYIYCIYILHDITLYIPLELSRVLQLDLSAA